MLTREEYEFQFRRMLAFYGSSGIVMREQEGDVVDVTQERVTGGFLMNQPQLVDRGKSMYPDKHIHPHVFRLDTELVTLDWVQKQLKRYKLKRKDLEKQLDLDPSTLSQILTGKRGMTKSMKALFYYYFMVYEVNEIFRGANEDKKPFPTYEEYVKEYKEKEKGTTEE